MHRGGHDCTHELHEAGFRATPARLAILHTIEHSRGPLAARDVARKVPKVNETTVYRTLEALAEKGLLLSGEKNRVVHYMYAAAKHHHHMVCQDCGYLEHCRACTLI